MMFFGAVIGYITIRKEKNSECLSKETENPLDLTSVFILSLFMMLMLVLISISNKLFGASGSGLLTFAGGLVELHSVTFAAASMYMNGMFTLHEVKVTLSLALLSGFVSKFIILLLFERNKLGLQLSGCLLSILIMGLLSFMLFT